MEKNSMNSQPLFSVLIANYNNGKYLMEAIDSVNLFTFYRKIVFFFRNICFYFQKAVILQRFRNKIAGKE